MEMNCWYAVQVFAGRERRCMNILSGKNYDVFLLTPSRVKGRNREKFTVEMPLFPGYLFCKFNAGSLGEIVTTPGLVRIVGIGKRPLPVSEEELDHVRTIVASGVAVRPWRHLPRGSKVRIDSGPLAGISGFLVSETGRRRLVVSVSLLQRSISVELSEQTVLALVCSASVDAHGEDFNMHQLVPATRRRCNAYRVA